MPTRGRPHRIDRRCESTSSPDDQAVDKAFIKGGVSRAAVTIDEMLEEIMKEMFADSAARYIESSSGPGLKEEEAVRSSVIRRLEFMDANFLGALTGYIDLLKKNQSIQKVWEDVGQEILLPLLESIRSQVLYQVALRLPPAARILNRVLRDEDKDSRLSVLRQSMSGGQGDLPGSDSESLFSAASQFIDDMEDGEIIMDRRLLARLCLVREEVRWIADERSFTSVISGASSKTLGDEPSDSEQRGEGEEKEDGLPRPVLRTNVPQRPAAFITQLVSVADPSMRVALMSRAFCEDWEGAAPRQKAQTAAQKGQPDFVRPGRFMSALHLMMSWMEGEGIEDAKKGIIMRRLADIQLEAVNVLDRMQRGELIATTT